MTEFENELQLNLVATEPPSEAASSLSSGAVNPDNLHDLFEAGGNESSDEEDPLAQLRNDPNYAALIRDLEYIAAQARSFFDPVEKAPSDALWDKIQSQLPARSQEN